ncbi:MAG: flagellar biosynthetic protein FliO [Pseudomonadota bacterium]
MLICISWQLHAAEPFANATNGVTMTAYAKVILGLLFVLGLFMLTAWLFRRYGNGPMLAKGQMKIIDGLHISNKERLVLVDIQGKQILLAITPGQITKLDTLYQGISETVANPEENYDVVHAAAEQSRV